ncbi:MAG TPA: methionyl-tRNA formyltransferase [Opitutaceae bacterium]|nr:methionyl-tRNA formyltransferase [Opitutaceae bacterium]HND60440.1 methionyl-tRNA formyltransferase [Opitutaceae bacterium]
MSAPLRLVFLGSDPIALPLLDWLAGEGREVATVVGVFTQPDRATGRGQKVAANEIKVWAAARGLPVHQPEKITEPVRLALAELRPDVSLVMAYGHILRDDFIATPRLGSLNLHTSLLPKYRGASPIQTAVAGGDRETGVTLMRIVRQLDAGPVADVERVAIGAEDTALDLDRRLGEACVPLLRRALPRLRDGTLIFTPQDEAAATFCRRLEKGDGALDFRVAARALAARINGLFPWPACTVTIQGVEVKFGLAVASTGQGQPGEVVESDSSELRIATGEGILAVRRLQRPGGRMLAAAEFLRGFPIPTGTVIASREMTPLVGERPFRR